MVGVLGSFDVILKVEVFNPVDVGLKPTLMVKDLPGLIVVLPPPLAIVNIEASVPVMDVVINKRSAFPLFLTLKEAVLLFFILILPKL